MAFCSYCGAQLAAGAKFCSSCGAAQNTVATAAAAQVVTAASSAALTGNSVMLVSLGTCAASTAADLIEDTCGYSAADAALLVSSVPVTLAQNLTLEQASVLAQALAEYGMEVTVFDNTGYRTVNTGYSTVYDNDGNILTNVAAVLGLIGAGNRIARSLIRRQPHPYPGVPPMFAMPGAYRRPPKPRRHNMRGPVPQPPMMERRAPQPPHGPAGRGGMEPRRSEPVGGGRGGMGGAGERGGMGGPGGRGGQGGPGGRGGQGGPGGRGGQGGPGGRGGMGGPGGR